MDSDNTKLEKIRNYARTTVLEPETQKDEKPEPAINSINVFSNNVLKDTKISQSTFLKTQSEVAQNFTPMHKFEQMKQQQQNYESKKYLFEKVTPQVEESAPELVEEETTVIEGQTQEEELNQEILEEEIIEEQIESLFTSSLSIESVTEEDLEDDLSTYAQSEIKSYKFRFKLLTGVFCCLLAILTGWIIGNIVEIATTNTEIATQTEYAVDLKGLISNISKLDKDETPASPSDGSLLPIEEIIPVTPGIVEDTTGYESESNWFDKICNWLSNFFGG